MSPSVREPIQVYLSSDERAALDRAARALGVSRSEVLRRGLRAVSDPRMAGLPGDLASRGWLTPASAGPGAPPPSLPVAPLGDLLDELAEDRRDR